MWSISWSVICSPHLNAVYPQQLKTWFILAVLLNTIHPSQQSIIIGTVETISIIFNQNSVAFFMHKPERFWVRKGEYVTTDLRWYLRKKSWPFSEEATEEIRVSGRARSHRGFWSKLTRCSKACLIICASTLVKHLSSCPQVRWLFSLIKSFYFSRQVFRHVTQEKAISRVWFQEAGVCVGSMWHLNRAAAVYDAKNISFPLYCRGDRFCSVSYLKEMCQLYETYLYFFF